MTALPSAPAQTEGARLSLIAQGLTGSSVVESRRRADRLAEQGVRILDLGAGEPDFSAPPVVVEAAMQALRDGNGQYVDPRGLVALRERIADMETTRHGHPVTPDQVVVTTGSFGALSIACRAILDPGDEVLIPEPFWGPYRNLVQMSGGVAVPVPAEAIDGRFSFPGEALAERITARTRAIVINSPNNPTGRVLSPAELRAVADLALAHDLWIVADEVYGELVFGDAVHRSVATLGPEVARRTIIVNSLSKTFAMTGWRLGYSIARPDVATVLARMNHYSVRCPTSFVQQAAVTAFDSGWQAVEEMRQSYLGRGQLVARRLARLPGVRFAPPEGTFYAFPRIPEAWGDGTIFAARLLDEAGVLASAGRSYGASAAQHLRFSFATSTAVLDEAFDRIERLVGVAP
ncbi:L-aspartate aminotransferase [Stella humosa]|uniref:Aminotransferase n=1 Tax=Stella humosa TaxID=94 RepID=A0A3N1KTL1_9PROT|nr:pyridoxal phosphate-dependent aminotransferase [Stella humosa]ROP81446.1 L-aspartate aminotransferase [Stella humosa]BBK32798.1 aspartate aminotransferase [Stella humosa]